MCTKLYTGNKMDLIRIGDKVLSWEKLEREIEKILKLRTGGLTQTEVARKLESKEHLFPAWKAWEK